VRVLLPVLLLLLVPARAPAQMSLQGACNFKFVSERTIDPLRASVEVFFDSQWPGGGAPPCSMEGYPCYGHISREFWSWSRVRVTPCPEGVTCVGGAWDHTWDAVGHDLPLTFVLRCGTTYTFEGWYGMGSSYTYWLNDPLAPCWACSDNGHGLQTYASGATPVRKSSWGMLKVQYR
jgi:hypothetical protein